MVDKASNFVLLGEIAHRFDSMFEAFTCLTTEHDGRTVALAILVCLLASSAAISLFYRAQGTQGRARYVWLSLDAVAAGSGIWATHFIAMLAYEPNFGITYDLPLTIASLLLAIAITGAGLLVAVWRKSWLNGLAGGAIVGLGIGAMHFTGISAIDVPGHVTWAPGLVATSILFGTGFGAFAFSAASGRHHWTRAATAIFSLSLAILALHFTGMAALSFRPDPSLPIHGTLSREALSIGVAGITAVILAMCLVAAFSDLRSKQKLRRQQVLLDTALENMSHGLCMFDPNGRIVLYNNSYLKMFNLSPVELDGRTLLDILRIQKDAGEFPDLEDFYESVIRDLRNGKRTVRVIERDGRTLRVTDQPMTSGGWVATFEDITDWQRSQTQISHMAHHDHLTDLPNRTLFREQLALALRKTARNEKIAIHCVDLDRFKSVNDTLGHPIGDELLKQVATRLQGCIREGDMVARLGGDEFSIVQAENDFEPSKATALAARVIEALSAPYNVNGHAIVVGASVGIAVAPDDGNDPDELLRNADMALYRAKSDGRGTYRFFEPGMDATAQARRLLELDLRTALLRGEFEVFYQPIHDLRSGRITAFEALVRWNHPQQGMVQPDRFIRLAEETGLIVPIGEWVLRRACADAAGWSEDVDVAVNLSPAQFRNPRLVPSIFQALADSGLAATRLELEITESVLLQDNEQTLASLHRLRERGIRISMDDFGTGYSALSYLRSFPFSKIKIDRTFVRDLSSRDDSMAIVRAVTGLGKSLGIITTAEGVETAEQLSLLTAEGCTEVQGFLFNAPQPAANVEKMLSAQPRRRRA